MPAMSKNGKPRKDELPATIARSELKAQKTFAETHDSAVEQYGDGARAHQTAFASLKRTHEKVGEQNTAHGKAC